MNWCRNFIHQQYLATTPPPKHSTPDGPSCASVCGLWASWVFCQAAEYRKVVDLLARLEKDVWSLREIYNPKKNQTKWYRGFLKWWVSPTNPWVFLLKMIITWGVKMGGYPTIYGNTLISIPMLVVFWNKFHPKGQLDRVLVSAEAGFGWINFTGRALFGADVVESLNVEMICCNTGLVERPQCLRDFSRGHLAFEWFQWKRASQFDGTCTFDTLSQLS